jgi:hypothetical protein
MSGIIGTTPTNRVMGNREDSAIESIEYRLISAQHGSQNPFATTDGHWEIPDTEGQQNWQGDLFPLVKHPSSGNFAFNKRGRYLINFHVNFISNTATSAYNYAVIRMTTNNSTYNNCAEGIGNNSNAIGDQSSAEISMLCKIDDLTQDKICFQTSMQGGTGVYAYASSTINEVYVRFTRLGPL